MTVRLGTPLFSKSKLIQLGISARVAAPTTIPGLGRVLFLLSVIVIWYVVGRALDRQRATRQISDHRAGTVLVVHLLLLGAGGVLFFSGMDELRNPPGNPNPVGALLSLAWSVGLILISGRALFRAIRGGHQAMQQS
jgi:hypothetical protein